MFGEKKRYAAETSRGESATLGLLELRDGGIMRHACDAIYVIAVKCEVPVELTFMFVGEKVNLRNEAGRIDHN